MKFEKNKLTLIVGIQFVIIAVIVIFLIVTNFISGHSLDKFYKSDCYTLYIGLNDKNTYKQEISTDTAIAIVDDICTRYVDGFTMFEAKGCWTDDKGTIMKENTLVYMFYDTTEESLTSVMDEVLVALNQSEILVRIDIMQTAYYDGTTAVI